MAEDRIAKWNARYGKGEETYGFRPHPLLAEAVTGVRAGRALDFACGAGRHTLWLAEHGWDVVAVDGSSVGIDLLREEARRRGLEKWITPEVADLTSDAFAVEPNTFDLVCDFFYLQRDRFEELRDGVCPGGLLVAAIHIAAADAPHHFLLEPGELRALAEGWGWETRGYREGRRGGEDAHSHATAELVARKPTA